MADIMQGCPLFPMFHGKKVWIACLLETQADLCNNNLHSI